MGTILGGPIGDRYGRKPVIWGSILGVLPFTLLLPHAGLFWTAVLSVVIGLILSSAFSAIVVYAQELVPGRVGLISGVFFGFAFGMGGLGAAALGEMADVIGIEVGLSPVRVSAGDRLARRVSARPRCADKRPARALSS